MKRNASDRISSVVLPDPVWRYLILFQSWNQFFSCAALLAIVAVITAFLLWLAGDVHMFTDLMGAALFGGVWAVVAATKAQFSIRSPTTSEKARFETMLDEWRYVMRSSSTHEKRFGQNLPRFLRWSDSDVTIVERDGKVICTGPQMLIRKMRKLVL